MSPLYRLAALAALSAGLTLAAFGATLAATGAIDRALSLTACRAEAAAAQLTAQHCLTR